MHFSICRLSERESPLYPSAKAALLECSPYFSAQNLTAEEINRVLKAVLWDTPELFWFTGKWRMGTLNGTAYVVPVYLFEKSDVLPILHQMELLRQTICAPFSTAPQYQQIEFAYSWLLDHVDYGLPASGGQTIYDALVGRKAVCKGISKAFQYLLAQFNCACTLQEGTLDGTTKHIWNMVMLDGNCYHVDVCMGYCRFDSLFQEIDRSNPKRSFLVSDAHLLRTHQLWRHGASFPVCTQDYGISCNATADYPFIPRNLY